ncbi:PQQ-dependent sugar dehydrogenase [Sphingosinicella rhizophila]|uniref:Sorbosone dehydrogenase family protein n=1 Tax=Sphingosinicella rhizophila TaxID=3050082 RepID=A0ABU3QAE8_9SPHN|nr:sorbosone dehydrogenase family protein [Sphingosinicella sp. GR2756]MDT9600359.1 sorbosone dehydrogenase family protein [Sphingosinicella sp. GR2756]
MIKRILIGILIILAALIAFIIAALLYLGWPDKAQIAFNDATGQNPRITAPREQAIPTINVAEAIGWQDGAMPQPADGLQVMTFAAGLEHPRWLYRLPNGDILVAESNSPARGGGGFGEWVAQKVLGKAGALVPSPNRITLLRDADGDGKAESRSTFLSGINSPFGMTLVGKDLYIANSDALVRYPYEHGQTRIDAKPETIITYPSPGHWARNVIASPDGKKLYVSVGSASNIAEGGIESEKGRALILEVDPATKTSRVFGAGLRNPNGMAFEPRSGKLWTVVNERDQLGSDLSFDYLTSVSAGDHFGWPWYYWGQHEDTRVKPANPALKSRVRTPDYSLGPHTAPLGLSFAADTKLGPAFANGAFIGLHGSWNRKPLSGYKVVYVPFGADGRPAAGAKMVDVLTGFLSDEEKAQGRPVGVITDRNGALLVADDVGNTIWRVSAKAQPAAAPAPAR